MTESIFDPGVLPLQKAVIYGPVLSRRLGYSLGINILSPHIKICSFDCVYCQYGKTELKTQNPDPASLYSVNEIIKEVEKGLMTARKLDFITFSGNGEPTLHPQIAEIVTRVKKLRDQLRPDVKLAMFSNVSELQREDVRHAIGMIDQPILKLDGGDEETIQRINRPVEGINLTDIVSGIRKFDGITLQTLFLGGKLSNSDEETVEKWIILIQEIHPKHVQIYSTDRAVAEEGVEIVPPYRLKEIAEKTTARTGVTVTAYWPK
jgi:wyosine [tRNA(Phe)-imidazoG37] synthetase (radical SAM superfamily)